MLKRLSELLDDIKSKIILEDLEKLSVEFYCTINTLSCKDNKIYNFLYVDCCGGVHMLANKLQLIKNIKDYAESIEAGLTNKDIIKYRKEIEYLCDYIDENL